jgi:glycerol-3-phosphate dehydrogenase subunit B
MGGWLGAGDGDLAGDIAGRIGVPIGEVLGSVGGAAGARFEAARARMLAELGVALERVNVTRVDNHGDGLAVWFAKGEPVPCDAVVLAVGGLAAGGIVYDPPEQQAGQDIAASGAVPFHLSLEAPVRLRVAGKSLDVVGSMHGPALDELAWPTDADPSHLEAVGIGCNGVEAAPQIYAAGDAIADRPRTLLQAMYSGAIAGTRAAG